MDEREGGTSQFVLSFEREGGDVASFDGAKIAHFPRTRNRSEEEEEEEDARDETPKHETRKQKRRTVSILALARP